MNNQANMNNLINNADVINNHNIIINNNNMQNIFVNCKNNLTNYIDRELMREYLLAEMNYYLWSTAPGIHNNAYGDFLLQQLNVLQNNNFTVEVNNMLNNILNDFQLLNLEQKKIMYNYISNLFRNY
jgi:hypothetical protein